MCLRRKLPLRIFDIFWVLKRHNDGLIATNTLGSINKKTVFLVSAVQQVYLREEKKNTQENISPSNPTGASKKICVLTLRSFIPIFVFSKHLGSVALWVFFWCRSQVTNVYYSFINLVGRCSVLNVNWIVAYQGRFRKCLVNIVFGSFTSCNRNGVWPSVRRRTCVHVGINGITIMYCGLCIGLLNVRAIFNVDFLFRANVW